MTTKPTFSIELEGLNESIEQHVKEAVRVAIQSAFNDPLERKAYFNKGEAAAYIGVSRTILEKLIRKGLPIVTIESKVLISKEEIHGVLKEIQHEQIKSGGNGSLNTAKNTRFLRVDGTRKEWLKC